MTTKPRLIYCGLDLKAWGILARSQRFEIVAVNKIEDFLDIRGFNPCDALFRAIYALRCAERMRGIETLLGFVYRLVSPMSSRLCRRYAGYLLALSRRKTPVLDLENEAATEAFVRKHNVDVMLVNNWWLLKGRVISAPRLGTVNIHPSRLPQYRGSLPTLWTLKNRDRDTAVSVILLSEQMDAGGVIAQFPVAVAPEETAVGLEGKIEAVLEAELENTLEAYVRGDKPPQPQGSTGASATARYFPYMKIDWAAETARDIVDKVNLYPYLWPAHCCWARWSGKKLAFRKSEALSGKSGPSLSVPGAFCVEGMYLYARASDSMVRVKLFSGIAPVPSLNLLAARRGNFGGKS
jgi:methionyl-tRNA formyltransferase